MKKFLSILVVISCIFITGCKNSNDPLADINKKYNNLNSYELTGDLEIVNNDDVYNYDVKVIYQKKDKYYVSLKNRSNSYEQIILKNEDGVYVKTHKSTKQKINVI